MAKSFSPGANGAHGLGTAGKGKSLAAGQGKKRYSRKRISKNYGGGK